MSATGNDYEKILIALQQSLAAFNAATLITYGPYVAGVIDQAYENEPYEPTVGRPYQFATLLPGETQQPGNGPTGTELDVGIFQVDLYFPRDEGAGPALGRAQLLRAWFARGRLVTYGGTSVKITRRASLGPGMSDPTWHKRVVSIPYFLYS